MSKGIIVQLLTSSKALLYIGLLIFLVSCTSSEVPGAYPSPPPHVVQGAAVGAAVGASVASINDGSILLGIVTGALLGAPLGSYRDVQGAINKLAEEGITVIQLGNVVEVVIPHDLVFDPETYDLTHAAEPILNRVVALLKQYGDVNMTVVGHSDDIGTEADQLKRSRLQAAVIMSYLWSHGIASQRLSFYGVGATDTTASLKYVNGQAYNRRIVIIFWRNHPPGPFNLIQFSDPNCWTKANPDACGDN